MARAEIYHLQQLIAGRQTDAPQEALQVLDIVLRELSNQRCLLFKGKRISIILSLVKQFVIVLYKAFSRYISVGRSFYSPDIRKPQWLGDGLQSWCGFYQSIRPTQMGLSLNIGRTCVSVPRMMFIINTFYSIHPFIPFLLITYIAFYHQICPPRLSSNHFL